MTRVSTLLSSAAFLLGAGLLAAPASAAPVGGLTGLQAPQTSNVEQVVAGVGGTADTGTAAEASGVTGTTTIRITMHTRPTMDTAPRSGYHSAVDATSMVEVAVVTGAMDAGKV